MRLSFVLAGAAWIGLFIAGQVRALPLGNFCETHPESTLRPSLRIKFQISAQPMSARCIQVN